MKYEYRWKALVFIFLIMLAFALVFQGMPPVFGFLITSLRISHAQAGALMSLFGLPGIFVSIPGGILSDIYSPKRVGVIALIITFLGSLIVGLSNSFFMLALGRIITGIGALTISVIAPQALSLWFREREIGIAMGVFNMVMPLATILTLNTFGIIGAATNWRVPLLLTSVYCILVLLLFYFKYPDSPKKEDPQIHKKPDLKKSMSNIKTVGWPVWLIAIIWMLYNASAISYLSFGTDYYISLGYDGAYAGFLTSILMIGALFICPIVGFLTDKIGKEEYFIIGGCIVFALSLFLVPRVNVNPLVLGILIGISASFIPPPVFSLVPRFLPANKVGLGYGILSTCLNFGVLVGPLLVGILYDRTSNYFSGFNLMALLTILIVVVGLFLKFLSNAKDQPV